MLSIRYNSQIFLREYLYFYIFMKYELLKILRIIF